MNEYIFYTSDGSSLSPTNEETEKLQILGFENGKNSKIARKNLLKNNTWISEYGFRKKKIISKQIFTDENKNLLKKIIEYFWHDEKNHFEESDSKERENHIFSIILKLREIIHE